MSSRFDTLLSPKAVIRLIIAITIISTNPTAFQTAKKSSDLLIILKSITSNNTSLQMVHQKMKNQKQFDNIITTFDGINTIIEDVWVNKILSSNFNSISEDNLRLFHAGLDSRFRSCFDFDEFYETFTIDALHHQQMDTSRDTLKNVVLPKPKVETFEIAIQTPEIDDEVRICYGFLYRKMM